MRLNERKSLALTLAGVGCFLCACIAMTHGFGSLVETLLLVLARLVGWCLVEDATDQAYYERTCETEPPAPRAHVREPSNAQPPMHPYRSGPIVEDAPSPIPSSAFDLACRFAALLVFVVACGHKMETTDAWIKMNQASIMDALKADDLARFERATSEAEMWRSCAEVVHLNDLLTREIRRERSSGRPEDGRAAAFITELRDQAAHRCR